MAITAEALPDLLREDNAVKLAGIDVDGQLRGKLVSKKKFLSIATEGFGFCSVIFGWDMHDMTYVRELKVSNKENGYRDIVAVPDLNSYRRIPWENNVPFFLVSFLDPDTKDPIPACPRGLLGKQLKKLEAHGMGAMAGGESSYPRNLLALPTRSALLTSIPQPSTSSTSSRPRMCRRWTRSQRPHTSRRTLPNPYHP